MKSYLLSKSPFPPPFAFFFSRSFLSSSVRLHQKRQKKKKREEEEEEEEEPITKPEAEKIEDGKDGGGSSQSTLILTFSHTYKREDRSSQPAQHSFCSHISLCISGKSAGAPAQTYSYTTTVECGNWII